MPGGPTESAGHSKKTQTRQDVKVRKEKRRRPDHKRLDINVKKNKKEKKKTTSRKNRKNAVAESEGGGDPTGSISSRARSVNGRGVPPSRQEPGVPWRNPRANSLKEGKNEVGSNDIADLEGQKKNGCVDARGRGR